MFDSHHNVCLGSFGLARQLELEPGTWKANLGWLEVLVAQLTFF
jgi:hypothetical protein